MEPKIFDYNNPIDFLNAWLKAAQAQNPRFSLRSWALQLGLGHVAMLSMVLNRKRRFLPSLSSKISQHFLKVGKFNENEARYFDMLVLFTNASSNEESIFYEKILATLRPDQQFSTLTLDHFRVVSDWHHLAIVEMTELKDFNSDPQRISLRLGGNVNEGQVKEAIDRLIRVGLLERDGESLRKTKTFYATPTDVSNKAIRSFHSQMIGKAITALESQPVEERDITAHMMTISKEKLPVAKAMIRDFRRNLAQFLETSQGDAVYQVNIQLFNVLGKENGDAKYVQ